MELLQGFWTPEVRTIVLCGYNYWHGDASALALQSWIGIGLYYLAGLLAFLAWRRRESVPYRYGRLHRKFWLLAALTFVFLGLNKQFNLLELVTATARCHTQHGGYYLDRREYQREFIAMAVGLFGTVFAVASIRFRKLWPFAGLGMMGVALIWVYTAVRTISLHQIDAVLGYRIGGVSINAMAEIVIILAVMANAVQLLRVPARRATGLDSGIEAELSKNII